MIISELKNSLQNHYSVNRLSFFKILNAPLENPKIENLEDWISFFKRKSGFLTTIEASIYGGYQFDRLGYAFASGYESATRYCFRKRFTAFCATESSKGAHPKSIETTITPKDEKFILNGFKSFSTFGNLSENLAIVTKESNSNSERPSIKVVVINSLAKGVTFIESDKKIQFIPEIPHVGVKLENVIIEKEQIIDGDGYELYLKPFRTIEDIHIFAAFLGYIYRVAQVSHWEKIRERILSQLFSITYIIENEINSPQIHLIVDGISQNFQDLVKDVENLKWNDEEEKKRYSRDKKIFLTAEMIRKKRTKVAWDKIKSNL